MFLRVTLLANCLVTPLVHFHTRNKKHVTRPLSHIRKVHVVHPGLDRACSCHAPHLIKNKCPGQNPYSEWNANIMNTAVLHENKINSNLVIRNISNSCQDEPKHFPIPKISVFICSPYKFHGCLGEILRQWFYLTFFLWMFFVEIQFRKFRKY